MKHILIFLAVIVPQVFTLNSVHGAFEELNECLINSGVSNEIIFGRNSTPEEYSKLNSQWNKRHGTVYPLAYLVPEKTADIQKAVICSKPLNIRTIPKTSGHNFEKYTYGDSQTLVVDLKRFNFVNVDEERQVAIVGAGTRQGKLSWDLFEQGGYLTTYGVCPSVGIGGYTLGGGKGVLSRRHGMMVDNVVEMEIVDAEGRLLVVNNQINSDLFWALLGAGAGAFGIVTQLTVRIYQAPSHVFSYMLTYNVSDFPLVTAAFQNYAISKNLTNTYITYRPRATYTQLRVDELRYDDEEPEFDRLLSVFPPGPNITDVHTHENYINFFMDRAMESYTSYVLPNVNVTDPENMTLIEDGIGESYYHRKSFILNRVLSNDEIEHLVSLYETLWPSSTWMEQSSGKINEPSPNQTSYVHRNGVMKIVIAYEGDEVDNEWFTRARNFYAATQAAFGHDSTFQNYVDDEMEDYLERYYGSNLPRLIEIKTKYDPENYFYTPQSIPVAPVSNN